MPTFTNPVVLTDGTNTHSFALQSSKVIGNSYITTWLELAASAAINAQLKTKFRESSNGQKQSVAQISENLLIADGITLKPATFNISINCHPQHNIAELTKMGNKLIDAAGEANFWLNLVYQI